MFPRILALCLLALTFGDTLLAMPPPSPGMLEAYEKDGSLAERQAFARRLGNHKVDPALAQDAQARLLRLTDPGSHTFLPTPPSGWRGMPTKGTPKMFVLLIDFSDYPADPVNTVAAVTARTFGDGDLQQAAPYESLKSYYSRASYGQLTLTGTVFATYRPAYTRASMGTSPTTAQRQELIKEALLNAQAQNPSLDFTQFDNNNSGYIDYFAVLWTGPDTGWSNFWWAYQTSWSYSTTPFTIGGKRLKRYVWQWVANAGYPTRNAPYFDPKTLIHETGHALGLPDYYDYDTAVGPKGGVGDLDMMDGNWGDHNCFSKFLLDWITPTVITTSASGVTLVPAGTNQNGNAIMLINNNPGSAFGEYFMVQNRQRVGNDAGVNQPADGLLIWHVDSQLDPATGNADYLYDNSYTEHKLLRLMEADGLEEIEASSSSRANAGDYYQTGKVFGPTSNPSSLLYTGLQPWLEVRDVVTTDPTSMSFNVVAITPDTTPPTGVPSQPSGSFNLDKLTLQWTVGTAADAESLITGYYLQVGTSPGAADVFDGRLGRVTTKTLEGLGIYDSRSLFARVRASNGAGLFSGWSPDSAAMVLSLPAFSSSVLDNAQLTFKTVGPWTVDTGTQVAGGSSARSAVIPDLTSTSLQTWVQGPGSLTFNWKVSSESGYDYLRFNMDAIQRVTPISGEVPWTQVTYAIPTGTHFLQWVYTKDDAVTGGSDAAWVDQVLWSGSVPLRPSLDVNSDGLVDPLDLLYFARLYGGSSGLADLNQDGTVNDLDLQVLLAGL